MEKGMKSPYSLGYTLKWPYYFLRPSVKNHSGIGKIPVEQYLQPEYTGQNVRIIFFGDVMVMHGDTIPKLCPELLKLITDADLVIGNCEAPVGDHGINPGIRYKFDYYMPQAYLAGIIDQLGEKSPPIFLSTANNHSGDRGIGAYLKTPALLSELGVTPLGQWHAHDAPLKVYDFQGTRIGMAAWTHWMNNDVFKQSPGVNRPLQIETAHWHRIRREYDIDLLIGMPHWEYEWQHYPQSKTRDFARILIDSMGFDLVVGSHPHTLFPMEQFRGGLCVYSLGNLVGQGVAWSAKIVSVLEVRVAIQSSSPRPILYYRVHFFYQRQNESGLFIDPLTSLYGTESTQAHNRIAMLYEYENPVSVGRLA